MSRCIPIITEQYHGNSWWFYALAHVIEQCGAKNSDKVRVYERGLSKEEVENLPSVVFVASHSDAFLRNSLPLLKSAGKKIILIMENGYNYDCEINSVAPSYERIAQMTYSYLKQCGHTRIALIGFRTDLHRYLCLSMLKYAYITGSPIAKNARYFPQDSQTYFEDFTKEAYLYDAVVCPDYQVGLMLLSYCKKNNIRIPEDLFIIVITSARSAEYTLPKLTTVSTDVKMVGKTCYELYRNITRRHLPGSAVCINIPYWLQARKSTNNIPFLDEWAKEGLHALESLEGEAFSADDISKDINLIHLENCLQRCDAIDLELIRMILQGKSYEEISEESYISMGSIRYRVSKLYAISGSSDRRTFERLFKMRLTNGQPFITAH